MDGQNRSNLGTPSETRLGSVQQGGLSSTERACDPIALGTGGRMRKHQILGDLLKSFQRGWLSVAQLCLPPYLHSTTDSPVI